MICKYETAQNWLRQIICAGLQCNPDFTKLCQAPASMLQNLLKDILRSGKLSWTWKVAVDLETLFNRLTKKLTAFA